MWIDGDGKKGSLSLGVFDSSNRNNKIIKQSVNDDFLVFVVEIVQLFKIVQFVTELESSLEKYL